MLAPDKTLRRIAGVGLGARFEGYEMHMGETTGPDCVRPFARLDSSRDDGATSADGRVLGSYIHGMLASDELRAALLGRIGAAAAGADYAASVDAALDEIAAALEAHLDIEALLALTRETSR